MAKKVRCLTSFIIPSLNNTFGYNDEIEVDDKVADKLQKDGLVDILIEEPIKRKPKRRTAKKNIEADKDDTEQKDN